MATAEPRPDRSDISRLANEIQDRLTRETLWPEDHGKSIAIDVVSGEYEVEMTRSIILRGSGIGRLFPAF